MKQFAKVTFCGSILTAFILAVGIGGVKVLQALDRFHPLNPHECLPCPCEERGEEKDTEPELDLPRWPKGVVR